MYCDIALSDSHLPTFMMALTGVPIRCRSLAMPARNEWGVIAETSAPISFPGPISRRRNDSLRNHWNIFLSGAPAPREPKSLFPRRDLTAAERQDRMSAAVNEPISVPSLLKTG